MARKGRNIIDYVATCRKKIHEELNLFVLEAIDTWEEARATFVCPQLVDWPLVLLIHLALIVNLKSNKLRMASNQTCRIARLSVRCKVPNIESLLFFFSCRQKKHEWNFIPLTKITIRFAMASQFTKHAYPICLHCSYMVHKVNTSFTTNTFRHLHFGYAFTRSFGNLLHNSMVHRTPAANLANGY